jgi:hypothetical protein
MMKGNFLATPPIFRTDALGGETVTDDPKVLMEDVWLVEGDGIQGYMCSPRSTVL